MEQEVNQLFLSINKDADLKYETSIDKAKLFIKIVEALIRINTPKELEKDWNSYVKLKNELDYDYQELQNSFNPNAYTNRINISVKNNLNLINKLIKYYYSFIKSTIDVDDFSA